jgi:predicted DNA-binding mobile mystery protein A
MSMSNNSYSTLRLRQMERKLHPWRTAASESPPLEKGWVRALRETLGMSVCQIAQRLGVTQSRASQLEKAESTGQVTMASLQRAAEALGGRLVYAIVPHEDLEQVVRRQAEKLVDRELKALYQTMVLEDQAPGQDWMSNQRERLLRQVLEGSWRQLWDY